MEQYPQLIVMRKGRVNNDMNDISTQHVSFDYPVVEGPGMAAQQPEIILSAVGIKEGFGGPIDFVLDAYSLSMEGFDLIVNTHENKNQTMRNIVIDYLAIFPFNIVA
jgi:hypothetical protein